MKVRGIVKKKAKLTDPMKPQTSFFLYSAWARDEWKKNDPDTPYPEVLTRIGHEW